MTERSLDKWISDKIMRQRDRLRWGENMVPILVAAAAVLALGLRPAPAADVKYYDVPRGAHPHDVAPAPDGKVWYTAQSQGALGILDPNTGKVTQIPLGPNAAPHGAIVGPDRAAWITEGGSTAAAVTSAPIRDPANITGNSRTALMRMA